MCKKNNACNRRTGPDDMISKANPENWKDGVYIGEDKDTAGNVCDTGRRKYQS